MEGCSMPKRARDVMTADPACCSPHTSIVQVAKMMIQNDCGEIPIVDVADRPIGVVTDRDIVCRIVAEEKNPTGHPIDSCMTTGIITVRVDDSLDQVIATMERYQIRRVLVVDEHSSCAGIISQADVAAVAPPSQTGELVAEVSQETDR